LFVLVLYVKLGSRICVQPVLHPFRGEEGRGCVMECMVVLHTLFVLFLCS